RRLRDWRLALRRRSAGRHHESEDEKERRDRETCRHEQLPSKRAIRAALPFERSRQDFLQPGPEYYGDWAQVWPASEVRNVRPSLVVTTAVLASLALTAERSA